MADDTQSRALVGEISYWTHRAVEEAKRANAAESALRASQAELAAIDERFARRPALADCKTRAEMVERACSTAGAADHLRARVVEWEAKHEASEQLNQQLQQRVRVLEAGINKALHHSGNRWSEWGERAITVAEILDAALSQPAQPREEL